MVLNQHAVDLFKKTNCPPDMPDEQQNNRLKNNMCLKLFSAAFGIGVPVLTMMILQMFSFGAYSLGDEASCYAVEFPDKAQYSEDMT